MSDLIQLNPILYLGTMNEQKPKMTKDGQYLFDFITPKYVDSCCIEEHRNMSGGCNNCGDPCY